MPLIQRRSDRVLLRQITW